MKRPLFIFTIYMFVFMGVIAITAPTADEGGIESTSMAQVDIENN